MSARPSGLHWRRPDVSASRLAVRRANVPDRRGRPGRGAALAPRRDQLSASAAQAGSGHPRYAWPQRHRRRTGTDAFAAAQRACHLFILAADTGVTQSDLTIWKEHIGAGGAAGRRVVVLNKIDGQWDELKTLAEIEGEIDRQVLPAPRSSTCRNVVIFPVSAQKGLVAKINGDEALLAKESPADPRGGPPGTVPASGTSSAKTPRANSSKSACVRGLLESRLAGLREQLTELTELRGKNKGVVEHDGQGARRKVEFESGLQRYYAVHRVFSSLTNNLFGHLGLDALRQLTQETRTAMVEANFPRTPSEAMGNFFGRSRYALARSAGGSGEIRTMMEAVYKRSSRSSTTSSWVRRRVLAPALRKDLDRLEAWCNTHLTMRSLLTTDKKNLRRSFFEEVARCRCAVPSTGQPGSPKLRQMMAPMETQVTSTRSSSSAVWKASSAFTRRPRRWKTASTNWKRVDRDLRQIHALEGCGRARIADTARGPTPGRLIEAASVRGPGPAGAVNNKTRGIRGFFGPTSPYGRLLPVSFSYLTRAFLRFRACAGSTLGMLVDRADLRTAAHRGARRTRCTWGRSVDFRALGNRLVRHSGSRRRS